jgi:hypothetical protein
LLRRTGKTIRQPIAVLCLSDLLARREWLETRLQEMPTLHIAAGSRDGLIDDLATSSPRF